MPDDVLPPPYPGNTAVNGFSFGLDYRRIEQSDTWNLAPRKLRPWLLMLWYRAWQQIPAGAFANKDDVIAGNIGMAPAMFKQYRAVLLRGWGQASDGRIYHPVIVEMVRERLRWRAEETARKQAYRASRSHPTNVPRDNNPVPRDKGGVPRLSGCVPDTGAGTGAGAKEEPKPLRAIASRSPAFDLFWQAWPASKRKVDKKKCADKWQRKRLDAEAEAILAHVAAMKRSGQWRDGFEPAPLTYINGERWTDPLPPDLAEKPRLAI